MGNSLVALADEIKCPMQTVADYYEMSFLALRAVLGTSMERYDAF
jgi:hypothetical protein